MDAKLNMWQRTDLSVFGRTMLVKRFDKKARLISNSTETTIFVKYPIFQKAYPFFFRVLQKITGKAKKRYNLKFGTI